MTYDEAKTVFERLFLGLMDEEEAKKILIEMAERGETTDEIAAAAEVMRAHSVKLPVPEDLRIKLIDNCGTGGDKSGTFNISSTVSLLLAGAGCYVAKHGNRSITSRSGSADMLEALGIRLDLSPEKQVQMLQECGFTFIFAIYHHPAMKFVMPIRKSISHRTIFNILGPLSNPAGVQKQFIGVFDPAFVPKIAKALKRLGSKRAMVVSSRDGLDEISLGAPTDTAFLDQGHLELRTIDPVEYGIGHAPLEAVAGGDAQENARTAREILTGKLQGPKRDIVLINAAGALVVDGKARDIGEGLALARETIDSGRAAEALEKIIRVSNAL
ncbi:anthranilate phosphoribosyltransferase [Hydrogenimonas urashimensis]|uniref:anthranilate phosphoribosyltransferase n=1 Tax=Hydrogenimonas urashimensis TaxID=2740515 RepID=UPI001916884A|nr:anthranilate phosphoribosyltransferase [Hydrogenimonas urashimensis]